MATKHCALLGIPIQDGAGRPGCEMGPSALRTAGIAEAITELGFRVTDLGNAAPAPPKPMNHCNGALKALPQVSAWTGALIEAAYTASAEAMPIFMGGDNSLSAGTIPGVARRGGRGRARTVRPVAGRPSGLPYPGQHDKRQPSRRTPRLCQRPARVRRLLPGAAGPGEPGQYLHAGYSQCPIRLNKITFTPPALPCTTCARSTNLASPRCCAPS